MMDDNTNKGRGRSPSVGSNSQMDSPRSPSSLSEQQPPGVLRANSIQNHERANPLEFVSARAHLAAVLTGANKSELQAEVKSALTRVNTWKSTQGNQLSPMLGQQVFHDTLDKDYSTLSRFQSKAEHNQPRTQKELSAVQQLRSLHGNQYQDPTNREDQSEHLGTAILGAHHTKGENNSSFVSLIEQPEQLTRSKDDGKDGAKTIATQAPQLHTYTVPKVFTWSPQRMIDVLGRSTTDNPNDPKWRDEEMPVGQGGQTYHQWLGSTPKEETEVLFLGGDLDKYRTANIANPYLQKSKSKRK